MWSGSGPSASINAMMRPRSRPASESIARPWTTIDPASTGRSPAMARSRVDFPTPFGPTIASSSPSRIVSETSSRIRQPP